MLPDRLRKLRQLLLVKVKPGLIGIPLDLVNGDLLHGMRLLDGLFIDRKDGTQAPS
jgi:hypothetical protein